jgi:hypothetical protein
MSEVRTHAPSVRLPADEPAPTAWQIVLRKGIIPFVDIAALEALRRALEQDSDELITGQTMQPPQLRAFEDVHVQKACPLCHAILGGRPLSSVTTRQLDELFAAACYQCDLTMGEPQSVRYLLNAIDEWSRQDLIKNLLPEVNAAICRRLTQHVAEALAV